MADLSNTPRGTVGPTRISALAVVFTVGAVLGWALGPIAERLNNVAPRVPWTSVLVLLAIAAVVAVLAYSTYRTMHREGRLIEAQRAVNLLLIAKASALAGALVAGGYVGFALQFIDKLDVALPRERVIRSVSAAVAGVLIVVAGLLLERACRVPRMEDDDRFPGEHN